MDQTVVASLEKPKQISLAHSIVPGEWHWSWHILKGIFRKYHHTILWPLAKVMGYSSLDENVANFHYVEDFLEMVTIAIQKWVEENYSKYPNKTIVEWLHSIKNTNRVGYELVYACIHYFIPY